MVTLAAYAATILHDPTGKTKWEDLIREFFFKPLQLNSAVFFSDNHQWKNFAVPAEHYVDESKWTPMNTDFMQQ